MKDKALYRTLADPTMTVTWPTRLPERSLNKTIRPCRNFLKWKPHAAE